MSASEAHAALIYPHQLYTLHPVLQHSSIIYLVEDPLYFTQYPFHKKKLILHRASMKSFADKRPKKYTIRYIESRDIKRSEDIGKILKRDKVQSIVHCDFVDDWLTQKVHSSLKKNKISYETIPTSNFLSDAEFLEEHFSKKDSFYFHAFYVEQRKRLDILVEKGKPVGGKWSFDVENRKKLPKDIERPKHYSPKEDKYVAEAKRYVEKYFRNNPGIIDNFEYPINNLQAKRLLTHFLEYKLEAYGPYQDAIDQEDSFLFHSLLTPSLNIGLLTPQEIVDETLKYVEESGVENFASFEGFLRQVIGWREYVRAVYERIGRKQRTTNFFSMDRKIPSSFWNATTGIDPIDSVIERLLKTGYSNHIERLMLLSNFMLLCEFDPDEIYEWFMSLYIDAYDWVMVPNVYGMGLYADGGLMVTKPYISSSNYVRKMSYYKKGDWADTWDGLYWYFIGKREKLFRNNHRMSMILRQYDKMAKDKYKNHKMNAESFLHSLEE